MSILADTNVLLRSISPEHAHYAAAENALAPNPTERALPLGTRLVALGAKKKMSKDTDAGGV